MKLLGDWNWYLPRWLEWLPRLGVEPEPQAAPEAFPPAPARSYASAGSDIEREPVHT
jgi:RND superfamily putative drug exporter